MKKIKFIDLFSGLGGFRIGFEQACKSMGYNPECLFSSEIKKHAISTYKQNFKNDMMIGDIKSIDLKKVDNFDVLLAGFPCQSFSSAGVRRGFLDTRGTLFFEIEKILKAKKPKAFILENVEGLVKHDLKNKKDKIGDTLNTILQVLKKLGYKTNWKLLNAKNF
jgi:DNA (cytosine-5)-methyltransferase 1